MIVNQNQINKQNKFIAIPDKCTNSYYLSNPENFNRLEDLVKNHVKGYSSILRSNKYLDLYLWIVSMTPLLNDPKYKLMTKIYWIFNDIHELQYCNREGCTNELTNIQNIYAGYNKGFCSCYCAANDKNMQALRRQNAEETYGKGITCYQQTDQFRQQISDIMNSFSPEKRERINKALSDAWKNKSEEEIAGIVSLRELTCIDKYKVPVSSQAQCVKDKQAETNLEIYKSKSSLQNDQVKAKIDVEAINEKRINTKRKNKTFSTSKPEEQANQLLVEKFEQENVLRQYKSQKYPYNCDFYIKSIDTYIECNFHWTHGYHPFDSKNLDDIEQLNNLKLKKIHQNRKRPGHSNFYETAIYVWTQLDPKKRQTAKDNNLKFLEFFNLDQLTIWLSNVQ